MANRAPSLDPNVFSIDDLEAQAAAKLPRMYREYYSGGAMDLISLRDNIAAYGRYRILPRTLRNVQDIDTSTTLFGQKVTFPLGLSPSAMHKLAHPDGEVATSRAAASMNVGVCLSSYANTSLEDVKLQGKDNPYMMQMCVVRDRNITKQLLHRAEGAGYKALFLSVDVPVLGRRLNEYRNDFTLPTDLTFPNILSTGLREFVLEGENSHDFDPSIEWSEIISWLRANTNMQIWLKGSRFDQPCGAHVQKTVPLTSQQVLNPADALLAVEHGVDGILISNHGGRQLDGVPATLDCLRECAAAVRGRIQIAVDGGIRRGSDIFKALALGASHCFIGRIAVWGLAYNGQQGVELGLKLLLEEFKTTMALAGCRTIRDITADHLTFLGPSGRLHKL